jgi:AbrB family looped-hinge helix DNA binding protein
MSTVTSKGQLTIPKPIRDQLGLEPGTEAEFIVNQQGEYVLRRADGTKPESRYDRMRKFAGKAYSDMTTDELMQLLRGDD